MRMKFSERIGSFFDKCRMKMRRRTELREQQKQRTRRLLNDKYIRTEGSNAHFFMLCVGAAVLLLVLGIVGLIFPGISTAFSVMLADNLMMRIALFFVLGTLALVGIYFLWSLNDIIKNADEKWYEAGFFESAPRYEEDYEPFMYDPDEDEYRYEGSYPSEDEDEGYQPRYSEDDSDDDSEDDSDDGLFAALFGREGSSGKRSEKRSEEKSEEEPFFERDRRAAETWDSQQDVHVLVSECEIEGQGRVTLKYSGSYIKGLIYSAVGQFADRLYVKELNVNFLYEAFEVEIIADAAAGTGHAQMTNELYAAVRQQLGEIAGSSRIDLSLIIQNVRAVKVSDEEKSDQKQG